MKLAKQLGEPPRDVAARVTEKLGDAGGLLAAAEVSGPGFVNLAFSPEALAAWATRALGDPRLGVRRPTTTQTITVDYSAPNVAKEMHVGHLRSTVIGDAIVRTLEFAGHRVIRMNHLGDWGTQFGMLTQHMLDTNTQHLKDFEALGTLYREAKARFDDDPAFADSARRRVVALQARRPGDDRALAGPRGRLAGAHQPPLRAARRDADRRGRDGRELLQRPRSRGTVAALLEAGVAVESDGAVAVFSEQFTNPDGSPAVLIVRKSDGGYGYGATDLASIRYRIDDLHADRLIYITDARQSQHFQMVFAAAARAGWTGDPHARAHLVRDDAGRGRQAVQDPLGRDDPALRPARRGGRARPRAWSTPRARSCPRPSGRRSRARSASARSSTPTSRRRRQRDLVFSFDRMLALDGNTAPVPALRLRARGRRSAPGPARPRPR